MLRAQRHTQYMLLNGKKRDICAEKEQQTAVFIFWREFLQNRRREKSSSELRKRLRLMMVSDF